MVQILYSSVNGWLVYTLPSEGLECLALSEECGKYTV